MKILNLLILFMSVYVFGRKLHRKHTKKSHSGISCTYRIIGDDCKQHERQGGKKLACDIKGGVCKLANGEECNVGDQNDGYDHSGCLSGSVCSGTESSNGWGKCVDKETWKTKALKVGVSLGMKLE